MAEMQYVAGLDELRKKLRELPDKIAKKHLRAAVAAGAKVIRDDARTRVPVDTGLLRRSVIQKWIREQSGNTRQTFYVLWRRGKKYQAVKKKSKGKVLVVNQDAFYGLFVEFGTAKMAARPFMRPAFEMRKQDALQAIANKLREALRTEVPR